MRSQSAQLKTDRNAMLGCLVQQLPQEVLQWRDRVSVASDMAAMLDEQLDWCTNEAFAELRAKRIGIGEPRDYLQRVIDVDGARVLCGIRFLNLDPSRPFVELTASTDESVVLSAAARAALDAHDVFQPTSVRVFRGDTNPLPLTDGWEAEADHVLCAETLAAIATAPHPQRDARITLADADVDEAAAFVSTAYDAFAERSPEVARKVPPADRDELVECQADGRLAWWQVDGETAGLIAAHRERWFGMDGYLMVEEVVAPQFARRGTAAAAQRTLAESLAVHDPTRVLFGTIDLSNIPSRQTARSVGRREIAGWWFVRPRTS